MGMNKKTYFLNLASNGSFLHTSAPAARELLLKIAQSTPEAESIEFLEEKESQVVEPKIPPNPSTSTISIPDEEETLVLDIFNFEDKYFTEFGDTSKYHTIENPQNSNFIRKPLDMTDQAFYQQAMKELVSMISHEWLEELESSSNVICLDSPSTSIYCQIHEDPFDALYNPVVGVNIMSASFAHDLLGHIPLTPIIEFLKNS